VCTSFLSLTCRSSRVRASATLALILISVCQLLWLPALDLINAAWTLPRVSGVITAKSFRLAYVHYNVDSIMSMLVSRLKRGHCSGMATWYDLIPKEKLPEGDDDLLCSILAIETSEPSVDRLTRYLLRTEVHSKEIMYAILRRPSADMLEYMSSVSQTLEVLELASWYCVHQAPGHVPSGRQCAWRRVHRNSEISSTVDSWRSEDLGTRIQILHSPCIEIFVSRGCTSCFFPLHTKKETNECLFYRRVRCMHGRATSGGVPPVQPQVHVSHVRCPCYCAGNELPHVPAADPKHVPRRGHIGANYRV
jgi:hypothetical protein